MDEAAIKKSVRELNEVVESLPLAGLKQFGGTYTPCQLPADGSVEESLDNLRLQIKYLLFDLESTRRENRYLRQMLESRPRGDSRDGGADGPPKF